MYEYITHCNTKLMKYYITANNFNELLQLCSVGGICLYYGGLTSQMTKAGVLLQN